MLLSAIAALGGRLPAAAASQTSSPGFDWAYLTAQASAHRVIPLLNSALQATGMTSGARAGADRIRQYAMENGRESLRWTAELLKLAATLEKGGIPVIPYKGHALALYAYGDISRRQIGDLDLLVPEESVDRAGGILVGAGYHSLTFRTSRSDAQLRSGHHHAFHGPQGAEVELHWNLAGRRFRLTTGYSEFWNRAEALEIGGIRLRTLSRDDLLLALSIHGYQHAWRRLSWIADIAALVNKRGPWAWNEVLAGADATGNRTILLLALRLARDFAGAALEDATLIRQLESRRMQVLATQVGRWLFPARPDYSGTARYHWNARGGGLKGAATVAAAVFDPGPMDLSAVTLPPRLSFVYRLVRPLRLLASRLGVASGAQRH